jgi:type I restriction enzyme M protein
MPANHNEIEKRLWDAADELRANSKLKSSEYSVPVLGLIFLRYADHKFSRAERELVGARLASPSRRTTGKTDYQVRGCSLNPGRYVGVADRPVDDFDFKERLEELNEELETLNVEARELEARIAENVAKLLEAQT